MIGLQTIGYARPRQLLINNDFQCWQRGESFNVTDNTTSNGYNTADMIMSSYGSYVDKGVVSKLNKTGGIKYASNGYIAGANFYLGHTSYDDLYSEYKDKTVTLVIRCRKITSNSNVDMFVYGYFDELNPSYKQISIQNTEFKTYTFTFKFNSAVGSFIYRLNNNSVASGCGFEIEYVDLFEGDITYQHVKEDYATALMRCLPWLEHKLVNTIGVYSNSNEVTFFTDYVKKRSTPTINILSKGTARGTATKPNREILKLDIYLSTINTDSCGFIGSINTIAGIEGYCCKISDCEILISCEPL